MFSSMELDTAQAKLFTEMNNNMNPANIADSCQMPHLKSTPICKLV